MSAADKTSEPPSVGVNGCPVSMANRRGDKNQQFFGYKPQDEIVCDALAVRLLSALCGQSQPGRKGPRLAGGAGARPAVRISRP